MVSVLIEFFLVTIWCCVCVKQGLCLWNETCCFWNMLFDCSRGAADPYPLKGKNGFVMVPWECLSFAQKKGCHQLLKGDYMSPLISASLAPSSLLYSLTPSLPPLFPHPLFCFIRSCFCLSPELHQCLNQSVVSLMCSPQTGGKAIAMREALSNLYETNVFGYNPPNKMRPFAFLTLYFFHLTL